MATNKPRLDFNAIFIISLTLLAFALRLYQLGRRSLWYDELLQVDIAQGPAANIWPQLARHAAMPLDYYLLSGWIQLGRAEMWVRWPALLFGTLAIPLIYTLGGRLFNRRAGLLAATLLAVASFAVQYSQEVRPYALLTLLTLISYFGLWQLYATGRRRYGGVVLAGLLGGVFTHYFALFMLPPLGLFVAVQQLRHFKEVAFWQKTAVFALCLLLLLVALVLTGHFKFLYNVSFGLAEAVQEPATLTQPQAEKPNGGTGPPLERRFFKDKIFAPLATGRPAILLAYNFFFLLAVLSLLRRPAKHRAAVLLLLGWLIWPILLIYFFLLHRGTFYAIRYILYTLPAYLMLVAYGLDYATTFIGDHLRTLSRSNSRAKIRPARFQMNLSTLKGAYAPAKFLPTTVSASLPALIFLSLALGPLLTAEIKELHSYYQTDSREDWRAVGRLLHDHAQPDDAVIAVRAEPALNWYYPPAAAPFGVYSSSRPIWQTINQHPRRWFILSSYSRKRDQDLRDWLHNNGAVAIGIDRRVIVYLQQEGLTTAELLAEVKTFHLPDKALPYAILARQLIHNDDLETGRLFYQKALELADPELRRVIEAQMVKQPLGRIDPNRPE